MHTFVLNVDRFELEVSHMMWQESSRIFFPRILSCPAPPLWLGQPEQHWCQHLFYISFDATDTCTKETCFPIDPPLVNGFRPFIPLIQFPHWPCCVFHLNSLLLSHRPQCPMDLLRHSSSHTSIFAKTVRPTVLLHSPQSDSSMFSW